MYLPLAHETWFLDDPENYDWGFLGEGVTLALLAGVVAALDFLQEHPDGGLSSRAGARAR